MNLPDIDWSVVGGYLVYLGTACLLALPIAWNRGKGPAVRA